MLLNLLPGLRELRAPLAAGYLWLFAAWLAFDGDIPEPAGASDFFDQFEAVGAAAALTFAAYLIGSFLSDLFRFVWYAARLVRIGPIFGSPTYPKGLAEDDRLRERLIRIQASEPLSPEGAAALDELSKRVVRRVHAEKWHDVDCRLFRDAGYTVRGPGGGPKWLVGRRTPYEPRELRVQDPDDPEQTLALHVAVALGDELDTARFRLLSEQKDLFHEVDRLSAEGEFRLAVTPPLAAAVATLAAGESLLWLAALVPLYLLVLLGIARQEQSGDRIVYAIRAGKVRTPILEQLGAEADQSVEYQPRDVSVVEDGQDAAPAASAEVAPHPNLPSGDERT